MAKIFQTELFYATHGVDQDGSDLRRIDQTQYFADLAEQGKHADKIAKGLWRKVNLELSDFSSTDGVYSIIKFKSSRYGNIDEIPVNVLDAIYDKFSMYVLLGIPFHHLLFDENGDPYSLTRPFGLGYIQQGNFNNRHIQQDILGSLEFRQGHNFVSAENKTVSLTQARLSCRHLLALTPDRIDEVFTGETDKTLAETLKMRRLEILKYLFSYEYSLSKEDIYQFEDMVTGSISNLMKNNDSIHPKSFKQFPIHLVERPVRLNPFSDELFEDENLEERLRKIFTQSAGTVAVIRGEGLLGISSSPTSRLAYSLELAEIEDILEGIKQWRSLAWEEIDRFFSDRIMNYSEENAKGSNYVCATGLSAIPTGKSLEFFRLGLGLMFRMDPSKIEKISPDDSESRRSLGITENLYSNRLTYSRNPNKVVDQQEVRRHLSGAVAKSYDEGNYSEINLAVSTTDLQGFLVKIYEENLSNRTNLEFALLFQQLFFIRYGIVMPIYLYDEYDQLAPYDYNQQIRNVMKVLPEYEKNIYISSIDQYDE